MSSLKAINKNIFFVGQSEIEKQNIWTGIQSTGELSLVLTL